MRGVVWDQFSPVRYLDMGVSRSRERSSPELKVGYHLLYLLFTTMGLDELP